MFLKLPGNVAMQLRAYFLLFLAFWSQFDDNLLPLSSGSQSTVLTDDDDEFVTVRQDETWQRRPCEPKFDLVGLLTTTVDFSAFAAPLEAASGFRLLIALSPLYVLMSLQL
jgi:hypothetical protein